MIIMYNNIIHFIIVDTAIKVLKVIYHHFD